MPRVGNLKKEQSYIKASDFPGGVWMWEMYWKIKSTDFKWWFMVNFIKRRWYILFSTIYEVYILPN
jgi:hypothetical protein